MVELFKDDLLPQSRRSSKGNQLKWSSGDYWYKADYTGYEGLSEYVCSSLLLYSNMNADDIVHYDTEKIKYSDKIFRGCKSRNFLPKGWECITIERLFHDYFGISLYESIFKINGIHDRALFLVDQVERMTGLSSFGNYLCRLLTIDALFLNEDRHTHNIAVLRDTEGSFHFCPIFDNGASLLSDTALDYPMEGDIYEMIDKTRSKTLCDDFIAQLTAVEEIYGQDLQFDFSYHELAAILSKEPYYPEEQKNRVIQIVMEQKRKLNYLFKRY